MTKKTNNISYTLFVTFTDFYWAPYKNARYLVNGDLIEVEVSIINFDVDCKIMDYCDHKQTVRMSVDRKLLDYWATNGGTIRFGVKSDAVIDKQEIKDFLAKVDELTSTKPASNPAE